MGFIDNLKVLTGKLPVVTSPPKKKILIVEDEKPLQSVLQDRFTSEGYEVITANNGQEGLDMAISQKPDMIILDLLMPVMNGITMLQKLRDISEFKKLPVLVLTNAGEIDNIRQTTTYSNAASFLIKSNVTTDEIVEEVKTLFY